MKIGIFLQGVASQVLVKHQPIMNSSRIAAKLKDSYAQAVSALFAPILCSQLPVHFTLAPCMLDRAALHALIDESYG